ncbi:MAG: family N-acetyltransferase [Bacteroidetes bacterium]|jgi:ribosomal protein S18 acetylase RimI-like enzyme|nr:family N-acetyltransferase [Bacteroidota bacterium]
MLTIRKTETKDHDAISEIIKAVISNGDSFAYPESWTKKDILDYWCNTHTHSYTALLHEVVVGTFILKDNQPGRGSHIGNAAYAVSPSNRNSGVGKFMADFSVKEVKRLGYKALQFNLVVKTNDHAVKLWIKSGFEIIGEIPDAFDHKDLGCVNAYIMYKKIPSI